MDRPDIVVYPGTSSIHAETFARGLGAEVKYDFTPSRWALIIGVHPGITPLVEQCHKEGVKVCAYWIGSDSWSALMQESYRASIPPCDVHLAVHERIAEELDSWKVHAQVVYPCIRNLPNFEIEHPKEPLVGVYMPTPDGLYMFKETCEIARECKDIAFFFYGSQQPLTLPDNCLDVGRMTPEQTGDYLNKMTVMLRLCEHDGFPVGGIEVKCRGKHVIENILYPGFLYAKTIEDACGFLNDERTHLPDKGPYPVWYRSWAYPDSFGLTVRRILGVEEKPTL